MNQLLFGICLLLSITAGAQEFHFDLFSKYSYQVNNKSNDRLVYSNTKDPNIFLTINGTRDARTAIILDIQRMMVHHYDLEEIRENGEQLFNFKYFSSQKIPKRKSFFAHDYSVREISQVGDVRTVEVTIYKNSRKKTPVMIQTLTMKPHGINLFPLYRVAGLHPFEILSNIDPGQNYVVMSGTGNAFTGHRIDMKLQTLKNVDLTLVVPDQK